MRTVASIAYLIGTWNCSVVGGSAQQATYTFSDVLDHRWIESRLERRNPAYHEIAYFGYDEQRRRWVRFGADDWGDYFAAEAPDSTGPWILFRPERPGWTHVFLKHSNRMFSIVVSHLQHGTSRVVREERCRKR